MKDLNDKIISIILKETGIDVRQKSRLSHVVEYRNMYFSIAKKLSPKQTLTSVGKSVNKNHATVLHGMKMYPILEKYNPSLVTLKNRILESLFVNDNNDIDRDVKDSQIKYLKDVIYRLEEKLEQKIESSDVKKYYFSIINDLNKLLLDHKDRPSYDVLVMKLEAFRDLNLKMVVQ